LLLFVVPSPIQADSSSHQPLTGQNKSKKEQIGLGGVIHPQDKQACIGHCVVNKELEPVPPEAVELVQREDEKGSVVRMPLPAQ